MIRSMYFFTEKCKRCGKVITGENENSRKKARKDWYRRLNKHHEKGCIPPGTVKESEEKKEEVKGESKI